MTIRECLDRPKDTELEIERKRMRIEALRRMATRFAPTLTDMRVQTTPDPSRVQEFLADAADEEAEIPGLEETREKALACVSKMISGLPDEKLLRIMELRYLDRLPWEEIIDEMDMCPSQVYRLHKKALEILEDMTC